MKLAVNDCVKYTACVLCDVSARPQMYAAYGAMLYTKIVKVTEWMESVWLSYCRQAFTYCHKRSEFAASRMCHGGLGSIKQDSKRERKWERERGMDGWNGWKYDIFLLPAACVWFSWLQLFSPAWFVCLYKSFTSVIWPKYVIYIFFKIFFSISSKSSRTFMFIAFCFHE